MPVYSLYTATPPSFKILSALAHVCKKANIEFQLLPTDELPAPDTNRPTIQQLLTERKDVHREIGRLNELITLMEPHQRLLTELAEAKVQVLKFENRLQEIDALVGKGGQQV